MVVASHAYFLRNLAIANVGLYKRRFAYRQSVQGAMIALYKCTGGPDSWKTNNWPQVGKQEEGGGDGEDEFDEDDFDEDDDETEDGGGDGTTAAIVTADAASTAASTALAAAEATALAAAPPLHMYVDTCWCWMALRTSKRIACGAVHLTLKHQLMCVHLKVDRCQRGQAGHCQPRREHIVD